MKVSLMQKVDYWCGIPLCALFSCIHAITSRMPSRQEREPKRILFVELSEMGSAILAYSSMRKMQELYPDAHIYFLIFKRNRESVDLLEVLPRENVLVIEDGNFFSFCWSALLTLFKIRSLKIDTVLDLELFSRFTALYSYLTGAVNRIGFHNYTDEGLFRGTFITHPVLYNSTQHISLNFLNLVHAASSPHDERPLLKRNVHGDLRPLPNLPISESEVDAIWRLLAQVNSRIGRSSRLLVFNPDPGLLALRGWPLENYCTLAKTLLAEQSDMFVVVIGLDRSRDYAKRIEDAVGAARMADLTGRTASLREVLVLLSQSAALVTSDSGPAHIAALASIDSFVMFGPETPMRYAPLSDRCYTFTSGLSCSPCYSAANHRRSSCTNNRCMQELSVGQVLPQLRSCLTI